MNLANKLHESTSILTGIHLTNSCIGCFLDVGPLRRCADFDTYKSFPTSGVDDSV